MKFLKITSAFAIIIFASSNYSFAQDNARGESKFDKLARSTQYGKTEMERVTTAENILVLISRRHPREANAKEINSLIFLLNSRSDAVRSRITGTIGILGPKASIAAPALKKALPLGDCLISPFSSGVAIRLALKRIGENKVPQRNCRNRT